MGKHLIYGICITFVTFSLNIPVLLHSCTIVSKIDELSSISSISLISDIRISDTIGKPTNFLAQTPPFSSAPFITASVSPGLTGKCETFHFEIQNCQI